MKEQQQNFTVCGREFDGKSVAAGAGAAIVGTGIVIGAVKLGKLVFGKVAGYLAEKKAAKDQAQQMAQKVKEAAK